MKKTALNVHNKLYIKEFISSFKIFKKSLESYYSVRIILFAHTSIITLNKFNPDHLTAFFS